MHPTSTTGCAVPRKRQLESSHEEEETFAQRLARFRQAAGYTQRELADEIGISQRMVAYYEAQTDHPPTHVLPALTEVLGVSADELLGIRPLKRNRKLGSERLLRRLRQIEKLPVKERKQLVALIDTFIERGRLARRVGSD